MNRLITGQIIRVSENIQTLSRREQGFTVRNVLESHVADRDLAPYGQLSDCDNACQVESSSSQQETAAWGEFKG